MTHQKGHEGDRFMTIHRRAIVEVRWGPRAYSKALLEPGQTLRVGRSNLVDLAFPNDAQMSAQHLDIAWDGQRCRIRDLDSAKGTWLQGERVSEGEVPSGAWIQAGETNLMVYLEAHTPAGRAQPALTAEKALALERLEREENLFAVVDASRGARPLQLLREAVDEHRSLYDGVKGEALANSAPYLVALRRDSGLLERLVREGWGARWGIYLSSALPTKDVRRHLRRFLLVEDDETGERCYFRFYDPRTLRIFLPTCTLRQRHDFFGEIACFLAEGKRGEVCRFTVEASPP
jgi:hypothetical protein